MSSAADAQQGHDGRLSAPLEVSEDSEPEVPSVFPVAAQAAPPAHAADTVDLCVNASQASSVDVEELARKEAVERDFILKTKKQLVQRSAVWQCFGMLVQAYKPPGKPAREVVCNLCKELGRPVDECTQAKDLSNMKKHLKSMHPACYDKLFSANEEVKRVTLDRFLESRETNDEALQITHMHIVRFLSSAQLPLSLHSHPGLIELMHAASRLRPGSFLPMGRTVRDRMFNFTFYSMVEAIKGELELARSFFKRRTACGAMSDARFLTVMHDGWDSDQYSLLGVSASWINPVTMQLNKVLLGLVQPSSHSAGDVANAAAVVLARYGIEQSDIRFVLSDTTNSAKAASRNIAGEDGSAIGCNMHIAQLALTHALGIKTRSRRKEVVDCFPPGAHMYERARALVRFITSGKAKGRWADYVAVNKNANRRVIRIDLPAETRVAGVVLLFRTLLRSRWCLREYFWSAAGREHISLFLKEDEWERMEEFVAVLEPMYDLCMVTQVDGRISLSTQWLFIKYILHLLDAPNLETVDGRFTQWEACTTYEALPRRHISVSSADPETLNLIKRCVTELNRYFPHAEDHELAALVADPIAFNLAAQLKDPSFKVIVHRAKEAFIEIFWSEVRGKDSLDSQAPEPAQETNAANSNEAVDKALDTASSRRDRMWAGLETPSMPSGCESGSLRDVLDVELESYLAWAQTLSWQAAYREQCLEDGTDPETRKANSRTPVILEVTRRVDTLRLIKRNRAQFPTITRVATKLLGLPTSNGFQERCFSLAKLVDTSLRRKLGSARFEMLTILAANCKWDRGREVIGKDVLKRMDSADSMTACVDTIDAFFSDDDKVCVPDEDDAIKWSIEEWINDTKQQAAKMKRKRGSGIVPGQQKKKDKREEAHVVDVP